VTNLRRPTSDLILIKYTGFLSSPPDVNRRPPVFAILTKYTGFLSSLLGNLILLIINYNIIIIGFFLGRPRFFLIIIVGAASAVSFLLLLLVSVSSSLLLAGSISTASCFYNLGLPFLRGASGAVRSVFFVSNIGRRYLASNLALF
jgi:hypothetical protein